MSENYLKQNKVELVRVKDIRTGKRFRKDYRNMNDLKESIKEKGLINPITVKQLKDNKFELMAGGRRLKAIQDLKWKEVHARIYSEDLTKLELRSIELEENLQREDLSWQEELELKKQIHEHYIDLYGKSTGGNQHTKDKPKKGIATEGIAKQIGESGANFRSDLSLARAIEELPQLRKCKNKNDARKVLKKMVSEVENKEALDRVKNLREAKKLDRVKKELIDSYITKDVFEVMKKIKDGTFNLIECDPPYGIDLIKLKKETGTKTTTDGYKEVEKEKYKEFISKLIPEFYRILAPNSFIVFWFAYDYFSFIYEELSKAGFKGNPVPAFWIKPSGQTMQPESYLANSVEPFFYMRKGKPKLQTPGKTNKFEFSPVSPKRKIHPTERPVEMIEDILKTFIKPNQRVFVPFLGSGNTLIAAHNLSMFSMGADLDEKEIFKPAFVRKVMEEI